MTLIRISSDIRQGFAFTTRDAAAGRWTSPDPYNGSMSLSDPQSFNRYSYVQSQPTNFVDPIGLQMQYFDNYQGMGCVMEADGKYHCTEYIDRYWYDNGFGSDYNNENTDSNNGGGSGGTIVASARSKSDCENFVDYLSSETEKLKGGFAARLTIGGEFAKTGKALLDLNIKFQVTGFIPDLTDGGQQSDVIRHVLVSASSYLLDGIGIAAGADNTRHVIGDWMDGGARTAERNASIADNSAGLSVGSLIVARIRNALKRSSFENKLRKVLCV